DGRATSQTVAFCTSPQGTRLAGLDSPRVPGCPPVFDGWGRGFAPTAHPSVGGRLHAWAWSALRLPRQQADRVGSVRHAGHRLNASPPALRGLTAKPTGHQKPRLNAKKYALP